MLPKNKLADKQITRLKVFKDDEHKHGAQFAAAESKEDKK
jgi:large subunit ribosomal protein L13